MKKICKMIITFTLTIIFSISSVFVSSAESQSSKVVYDLKKGGTQSFLILAENGEFDKITIEEISTNAKIDSGTYKVTYETISWTAGFYIVISNNQIGSAYNPFYSVAVGTISSKSLIKNSNTMVTYAFLYKAYAMTYDTGVIAKIVNSELVVSRR